MTAAVLWGLASLAAALLVLLLLPRLLLKRAQDRLARQVIAREGGAVKLLTRGDLVAGRYRRCPGVLELTEEAVRFTGLFGELVVVATSRIRKITTGKRLSSGRQLYRLEVLRITRSEGGEVELVLSPASASAWRSHLGLWAVRERQADADRVSPGR